MGWRLPTCSPVSSALQIPHNTTRAPLIPAQTQIRHYKTHNIPDRGAEPPRSEPLRILFCGSDVFSCASLAALHDLHRADPRLVDSIDVLVRPAKPSGRGLRRVAHGPLYHLAARLGLPIHQRDTFTGWDLPLPGRVTHPTTGERTIHPHPLAGAGAGAGGTHHHHHPYAHRTHHPFNLIVAVSFGLFVPPRILSALPYGGLNLHPSLLPDLRGPAPLQWTILARRPHTGVTLQTLHPTLFDHGRVLAQTPPPGIPVPDHVTTADLLEVLAPEGARLLVDALQRNLHVGLPYQDRTPVLHAEQQQQQEKQTTMTTTTTTITRLRDAPKITKSELSIDWSHLRWTRDHPDLYPRGAWTAADLARRYRALAAPFHAPDAVAPLTSSSSSPSPSPSLSPTADVGTTPKRKSGPGLWTHAVTVRDPGERRILFQDVEAVPLPPALLDLVLAIVRAKKTALSDPLDATEKEEEQEQRAAAEQAELPENLVSVVWVGRDGGADGVPASLEARLPLLVEADQSVVIPVRVPYSWCGGNVAQVSSPGDESQLQAVRVKMIKVEGETSKPAAKALEPFMEKRLTMEDIKNQAFALDVMTELVK